MGAEDFPEDSQLRFKHKWSLLGIPSETVIQVGAESPKLKVQI